MTTREFVAKKMTAGKVFSRLTKNYRWCDYVYSSMDRCYMQRQRDLDGNILKGWTPVTIETIMRHYKEIF
jgi:hypothetical protein